MRLEILPRTELTLRILQALADGDRQRAATIAEHVGSSAQYVAQLLAPLNRAEWVRSMPGPTGGHELIVDLDAVSVLDLIATVEGTPDTNRCVMADRSCPAPQPCALHDAWIPARDLMTTRLAATPLSSLPTSCEVPT
jgi:Rrf2 family protein